jgi:hypothetical protein
MLSSLTIGTEENKLMAVQKARFISFSKSEESER